MSAVLAMTTSGTIETPDGTHLRYNQTGTGPFMFWIIGGTGIGDLFRHLAAALSNHFTSIYYDRRGFLRLKDTIPLQPIDPPTIATHAEDLAALIRTLAPHQRVYIFANCAGGTIAIELASRYPELVETLILHEHSSVSTALTPYRCRLAAAIKEAARSDDFLKCYVDAFLIPGCPDAKALDLAFGADEPQPHLQFNAKLAFHELIWSGSYCADIRRLQRMHERLVLMGGTESLGYGIRRPIEGLASTLGKTCWPIVGGHTSFTRSSVARQFAGRILKVLRLEGRMPTSRL